MSDEKQYSLKEAYVIQQLLLPDFDPAWDYATLYEITNDIANTLIRMLNYMNQQENASGTSDDILLSEIENIKLALTTIEQLLKPTSDFKGER